MRVQIPRGKSQFGGGKGRPIVKYGSKKAPVQSYSSGGANCAHMGRHIGTTWRIRLSRPSVVAMQFYVKLLWPLQLKIHQSQPKIYTLFWPLVTNRYVLDFGFNSGRFLARFATFECIYIGWQWLNFFIPYLYSCFSTMMWASSEKCLYVCYCDIAFLVRWW